jgi:hypothetical protein
MRPMTRLVLGLIVLVGILAAVALGLPAHVTVSRNVVINAPESAVFPYLNNLHHFNDWSPWHARDPQLQVSFSGPAEGKGAEVQWTSKVPSVGTGSMQITEAEPNRHIDMAVNFNGLEGTSSYDIAPSGSGSKVIWAFGYDSGTSPFKRWKALMLDGLVGAEYRAGLDKLKEKIDEERRPMMPTIGVTPEGGTSSQSEQTPSAALPPGAVPAPGGPAPQGAAAPTGQATAPGAVPAPATGAAQTGTAQGNAQSIEEPPATPAPTPKKKRRRQ